MPKILKNPRDTILIEAELLLKEKGYKKFSIRELASRCEVAIGTIYNYFTNKDAIIEELFSSSWNSIIKEIENINELEITYEEKMRHIFIGLDKFLKKHMDVFMEINKVDKSSRPYRKEDVMEPLYRIMDNIIEHHKEVDNINIPIGTRKMSIFIVSNMVSIIRGNAFSFQELILIITHGIS